MTQIGKHRLAYRPTLFSVMVMTALISCSGANACATATPRGNAVLIQGPDRPVYIDLELGYKTYFYCSHCGPGRTRVEGDTGDVTYFTDRFDPTREGFYYKKLPEGATEFVEAKVLGCWPSDTEWAQLQRAGVTKESFREMWCKKKSC